MAFKKGQSGNPAGRPRRGADIQAALAQKAAAVSDEMFNLLLANARDGDTAAVLKILALAGVKAEAEAALAAEPKQPTAAPFQDMSTNDLLKRANTSLTLS